MYLCLFTLYHVSAFMFTKIIKKGHYHDCDNGLVFLWTGLFAQPLCKGAWFKLYKVNKAKHSSLHKINLYFTFG